MRLASPSGSGQGGEAIWEGFRNRVNISWEGIMYQAPTRHFLHFMWFHPNNPKRQSFYIYKENEA